MEGNALVFPEKVFGHMLFSTAATGGFFPFHPLFSGRPFPQQSGKAHFCPPTIRPPHDGMEKRRSF